MGYVKVVAGTATKYDLSQLRRSNPQVSFPKEPTAKTLADYGVYEFKDVERPEVGPFEEVSDAGFEQVNGEWRRKWAVTPMPVESAEKLARKERDRLLSDTDYTQLADSPRNKQAWAAYRQALRDVPQQDGFPENVIWPTLPE